MRTLTKAMIPVKKNTKVMATGGSCHHTTSVNADSHTSEPVLYKTPRTYNSSTTLEHNGISLAGTTEQDECLLSSSESVANQQTEDRPVSIARYGRSMPGHPASHVHRSSWNSSRARCTQTGHSLSRVRKCGGTCEGLASLSDHVISAESCRTLQAGHSHP